MACAFDFPIVYSKQARISGIRTDASSCGRLFDKEVEMDFELFLTPSLGDNSYLVTSEGEAALVDAQRDAWRFLKVAQSRQATIRYVLETHVHNDYLSGVLEVQAATGAEIAAPARGNYQFPHRRMEEGAEVRLGALRLVAMETPGHTPEHIAWLVYENGFPDAVAVFTGGSLIVGSAGRTDLLGEGLTESLTRSQYQTLRRLSALSANVQVLPTHGAGSFCSLTPPGRGRTTTIGAEQQSNKALAAPDEETFLQRHRAGFLAYPSYYKHVGTINRSGPKVLGKLPRTKSLTADKVERLTRSGVWVIDGRDGHSFAQAHLPGSINIELDTTFATYVGWVTPFNSRLVLVLPEPVHSSAREAATQLFRIGYEQIEGYLDGGIDAWLSSRREVRSYPSSGIEDLCQAISASRPVHLLDVRQRAEWDAGHIPDSLHIFVGDLPEQLGRVPRDTEVWTICSSGHRSAIAASLLDRAGIPVRLIARSGVSELFARCLPWESSTVSPGG